MKKRLLSILLVLATVLSVFPVTVSAATATPRITKVNMTLNGALDVNFKVASNGAFMADCSVRVTVGDDTTSQNITAYNRAGGLYVYTAKVPAHRLLESMKIELLQGTEVVQSKENWTVSAYLNEVKAGDSSMTELVDALLNYAAFADCYEDTSENGLEVAEAASVTAADLKPYQQRTVTQDVFLKASAALYLGDACGLCFKFDEKEMKGKTLYVNGAEVEITDFGNHRVGYVVPELCPRSWDEMYHVRVADGGKTVDEFYYGVLSYAWSVLNRTTEQDSDLRGLVASMYLCAIAADRYALVMQKGPLPVHRGKMTYDNTSGTYTLHGANSTAMTETLYTTVELTATFYSDKAWPVQGFVLRQGANRVYFKFGYEGYDENKIGIYRNDFESPAVPTAFAFSLFGGSPYEMKLTYSDTVVNLFVRQEKKWKQLNSAPIFLASIIGRNFDAARGISVGVIDRGGSGGQFYDVDISTEITEFGGNRPVQTTDERFDMMSSKRIAHNYVAFDPAIDDKAEGVAEETKLRKAICRYALRFRGLPYVYGDYGPNSFDCSGFTLYVYERFGFVLTHGAQEQYLENQVVSMEELLPGDLVFFMGSPDDARDDFRSINHGGIYLGNNKFIHASYTKRSVVIDSLSGGFFSKTFFGACRILKK